jgi:ribosome-binding factor A
MRTHRPERVKSQIAKELSMIFQHEFDLPIGTIITITEVDITRKMEDAKVKISILPEKHEKKIMQNLQRMRGVFQHMLNEKMNIRPMPHIEFVQDKGMEAAARVEKILLEEGIAENAVGEAESKGEEAA